MKGDPVKQEPVKPAIRITAYGPPVEPPKKPSVCEGCHGRGIVSFGTDDLVCSACDGTGIV